MAIVDLIMPKMGESIMEATILKWNKQPGESVQQDESLLDIATDKVDSEVPSTAAGVVKEILFPENAVVPVGTVIAKIDTEDTQNAAHQQAPTHQQVTVNYEPQPSHVASHGSAAINGQKTGAGENRFYSPLVLNIASNEGIGLAELEKIPGTGNEGRVTKKDILQYVTRRKDGNGYHSRPPVIEPTHGSEQEKVSNLNEEREPKTGFIPGNISGNVEIQEMDRMRKLVAEHMVRSKQTSPHVTSFTEADVTNLVLWREKEKTEFEQREGTKLTLTPLFIEAVIKCIKKYPLINCSVQGDKIIIRKDINIGMATALPTGNLIVPVIRNADNYNR
ncbi:MAG TPA: dihydrolipoamide acetyltransferase family protein, partial [Puia sp.]